MNSNLMISRNRASVPVQRGVQSTPHAVLGRFISWNIFHQAGQSVHHDAAYAVQDKYEEMLQKAEKYTFNCPQGQLFGRAGRRCTLEDGERLLDWCIHERPHDLQPRVVQLRNLMRQGLGRERDVPWLAIKALNETSVAVTGCDVSCSCYIHVLQAALLGLKALYKLELEGDNIPMNPAVTQYTIPAFVAAAQAAVPGMSQDLNQLAQRLRRQICCAGIEERRKLLHDRNGYMSCVDLQLVSGGHHAGSCVGSTPGALLNPREFEQALMN